MAQPSLEQFTKRALLLKLETVEGTDPTPTAAANTFQIMEGKSSLEFDKVDRKLDRPFFTGDPFGVGNPRASIEGGIELTPPTTPGTTLPSCDPMLQIGGTAVVQDADAKTTRYNPISSAIKSATGYFYHAGTLRKAKGSRAAITGLSLAIGKWFQAQTKMSGSCSEVDEAALPTDLDYSGFPVPAFCSAENSTLLVGEWDAEEAPALSTWAKELSVDFGTDLKPKEFTTKRIHSISDRKATYKLRMARTAKADFDPWALMLAGTIIAAEFRTVQGAGGVIYSALGIRGQIEKVDEVEVDGDYCYELSGPCIASDAGGDEFYVEFGDTTP